MTTRSAARVETRWSPNFPAPSFLLFSVLLFGVVLCLAGCSGLTGAANPNSTGTITLAASATSFNFQNVPVGTTSSQTLNLTNMGTTTIMISQATVTGPSFGLAGQTSSMPIAAGQTQSLQVQFAPKNSGNYSGSVDIDSNAKNPKVHIPLNGNAISSVSISTQPASQTVTAGQTATFSVVASGSGTLTYQWMKNGAPLSSANAATYTTPATTNTDNGAQFDVVVTDANGSLTSNLATLTVTPAPVAPSITTQPANQTVVVGQTATFSVTATGTSPLTYQWNKNGSPISSANSASYTTPATTTGDSGAQFTVTVTNSVSSVMSNAATLTVNVPPSITAQPASQTVLAGQTATFSVTATGTGTLVYQWNKNGSAISGANSASYTTPATMASDNGAQFTVTVTNVAGSVTSTAAALTVNSPPSITSQPVSQTVNVGQTATFSVAATGTGPLTYQWQKNGSPIGTNSSSYTTPATLTTDSGAQFTVTVTNNFGSVTSNPATLTVNVPPIITSQPASQTVTVGQTATFSVTASGTGTLTYQWKKNGNAISGANSATYTTPAAMATDNGAQFTVVVTSSSGNITSSPATLTVNVPPSITGQPASVTVIAGQTATFSVTASGTAPLTYQWNRNGSPIGANSPSYTTSATSTADNGALFTVTVTNVAGNITSLAAILTVNAATFVLTPSVPSLNFSNVNVGSNSVLPVTFTNAGNSNVTISSSSGVTVSGAGYSASGIQSGQIIPAGQTATLNVTFAPAGTGTITGTATVVSNATNSPATISLAGTGVQPVQHSVSLTWTASTSTVTGYNVYESSVSGGPYTKVNTSLDSSLSYSDSNVTAGQTYYFVVTSVDSSGLESVNSNEAAATVP